MKAHLEKLRISIDNDLRSILPPAKECPGILHKAMRYSVFSGGKRIRPILVIESCRACGGAIKDALAAASAVELVHTYSLIHDDLPSMDDDDMRRGKPTSHKVFGEANAILAGDALLTLAFEALSRYKDLKKASLLANALSRAAGSRGMVGGQVLDLELKDGRDRDFINYLKTAKLFEVSVVMGAISAGASKKETELLARYGEALGMAFQIRDDILDGSDPHRQKRLEKECGYFIKYAKDSLKSFGKSADILKDIADYLLNRKY